MNGDPRAMPGDEMMVRGLVRKGWSAAAARQYVAEEAFRRRSRSGSPETAISGASKGLNSYVNTLPHAPDRKPEGSHEDANPLHARTNSLRGQD